MKKLICDICDKTTSYCKYHIRKKWRFFVFEFDSQGGCNRTLDVCDDCFERIRKNAKEEK